MIQQRLAAWLRPFLTLVALAGLLSLGACGGGGGAPNNPYQTPATPLAVLPAAATVYSGVPTTLTVTGGKAPYSVFTSDASVLPVTQPSGNTIVLLANTVSADSAVTVTVRDSSGASVQVAASVKPSLLLPASITITGNPACGASGAQLCSGHDGTATVVVSGAGGQPLAGRSVRFDVILGTFSLVAANSTTAAQSVTVQTDQNGTAVVTIRVPATATSQFGTLRATDVTSGSSVVSQFTIANSVLSVIPTGQTTFTGPSTTQCSSGAQASFYVFGGTPPYTIGTNFPGAVSLLGSPVLASGGSFTIVSNGTCFTGLTFAISDAAGTHLQTPPLVDNVFGATDPVLPLSISPPSYTGHCTNGTTLNFLATGGTGKYNAALSVSTGNPAITVSGGTITAAFNTTVVAPPNQIFNVGVTSGSASGSITITCN